MTADTPARQPQQQIVDGSDLKAIEDFIYSTMNHTREWELAENAYQRILTARATHTSPPAPAAEFSIGYAEGYKEGAKAAREQFASELIEKIEKYLDEREQPKCVVLSLQMVEKLIKKSLRAQQGGVSE